MAKYRGSTLDSGLGLSSGAVPSGELRRLYNFGNSVSELSVSSTPFFRLLSQFAKSPTNDPEFKGLEQRHQWQRRYVFVHDGEAAGSKTVDGTTKTCKGIVPVNSTASAHIIGSVWKALAAGDFLCMNLTSDYKDTGEWKKDGSYYNASGSLPYYIVPGQIINVPVMSSDVSLANNDVTSYGIMTLKVTAMEVATNTAKCILEVIALPSLTDGGGAAIHDSDKVYVGSPGYKNTGSSVAGANPAGGANMPSASITGAVVNFALVPASGRNERERRCYISGSAHAEGSGYPTSWKDKAIIDTYGYTQIFKTSAEMNNTARATVLRGIPNEWARMWKERLMEHKRDLEWASLFGVKYKTDAAGTDPVRYTQGAYDFIVNNGYSFSMAIGSKTLDSFIDDLGEFMHPEKGDPGSTIFMAPTDVFSYLSKVGSTGFAEQSLSGSKVSQFYQSSVKQLAGLNIMQIATPHGTMNLTKNINLDGSNVKVMAVNLKNVKYRPLVGNGLNRDTSIYVGVQSIENTGTDKRVDLIQTEAGLDWGMPEAHAVWL